MNNDHPQPTATTPSAVGEPVKGLPPVTPPSGRFIAQLFLVPGLIVAVAVLLLLAFRYLFGGPHTPEHFLRQLDSDNADIRWRGASDLAQVLKRPESVNLRCDAAFALDLAERLRTALDDLWQDEKAHAERVAKLSAEDRERSWRKLAPKRDHVQFLAAALGDFHMAVGLPLLSEIALKDDGPDLKANTLRRRQAVWAIANLGNQCKDFAKLTPEQQETIRGPLHRAASAATPRGLWARNALYYLEKTPDSGRDIVHADRVLAECAKADDRFLRVQVAHALSFWEGDLVEATLLQLAHDDGRGHLLSITDPD